MKLPRVPSFLLRRCAPPDRLEDLLGDLEEVHAGRVERHGQRVAMLLTTLEAVEIAGASFLLRLRHPRAAPVSWIDFKLGLRMLSKYPGLTLIGGLAMAFGIFAGAACFEFYSQVLHPELPFDEGDRVVDLSVVDGRTQRGHSRYLYDFDLWSAHLSTIEDVGAARRLSLNFATGEATGEPVRAAAMTASAFRMTRVAPLMGRTLGLADESPGAPDVAVIGYDVWQNRLGAAPDVIGRTVLLGGVPHTVVGVMPRGFGFPHSEQLWLPLRFDRSALAPLQGPPVMVFGRLVPGRGVEEARAELEVLIARAGMERPDVYEHLHARVLPYPEALLGTHDLTDPDRLVALSVNIVAWLFLALVCGNVALLMFARAVAREGEIVVRTALGASRRRIVSQLFSEALVLGSVAGAVGVGAAAYGLERYALSLSGGGAPMFWFHASLSPRTVAYAAALVVSTAVMTGAIPGLMITSRKVHSRLRSTSAGGGGLRLGGVWTAIIVVQVAATVTFPAIGWFLGSEAARIRDYEPVIATEEFLAAGLRLNASAGWAPADSAGRDAYAARLARTAQELTERLESEPWVKGVTRTAHLPGTSHGWRRIEMDQGGAGPPELDEKGRGRWVYGGVVAPDFFEVLGAGAIQGRTFHQGDAHPEARTVVVTEAFVDEVLGGRNPLGRRLRYVAPAEEWDGGAIGDAPGPWYRIVGVVPDVGMTNGSRGDGPPAGFYHAVSDGSPLAPTLLVRVHGAGQSFASRLREIAADVEPELALVRLQTLEAAKEGELRAYTWAVSLVVAVSAVAVLLSLAGIYAAMSFAVARRTREIGVRVALGAGSARVVWAIFRRPLAQVGTGLALGLLISAVLSGTIDRAGFWGKPLLVLLGYAALVTSVCLLACAAPVRRALAVEPREALAAD